jgi:putative MFS transporter
LNRRRHPWWIPPFLGRVPEAVDDATLALLGAVALAMLFEEYDNAIVTSALKHIAGDLHMAEAELPLYLAVLRFGAVPAFFLIPLADRLGRRPVFIASVVGMGVLTFATAFSQSIAQFVALQALTRTFFIAYSAVAFVIITEEFPAAHRGFGVGMLAALGACGAGLAAALFSQINRLPYGWRSLYAVGAVPVALLPFFLSRVKETTRFARSAQDAHAPWGLGVWLGSIAALLRAYPGRAAALSLCGFTASFAAFPSFQFTGYFTQVKLGWEPKSYAMMVVAGGAVGIIGNIVAGRLGDSIGRKRVGGVMLSAVPFASFMFYQGPRSLVVPAWIALVFCALGARVIMRALSTELFPTAHRSAASGLWAVLDALGAVAGLMAIYLRGTPDIDQLAAAIPAVSTGIVLAVLVMLTFPETRQRELEDIS